MRWFSRTHQPFLEVPHALTLVLVLANVAAYGWCVHQAGTPAIPSDVLLRDGAMYSHALEQHDYWRLLTYGFLHADGVHLAGNMICLLLWGGHLERRIGHLYFLLIYIVALVIAALVSDRIYAGEYLTVGASGATSGILGALLFLGLAAKIDLPASFFVVNIGLNVALAAGNPRINWAAHVGGFAAGLIGCALLDLIEHTNIYLFRCKFPEFVKLNGFVLVAASTAYLLTVPWPVPLSHGPGAAVLAALAIGLIVAIKLCDLILSVKKGLALVVVLLACANAAFVLGLVGTHTPAFTGVCAITLPYLQPVLVIACSNAITAQIAGAVAIGLATIVACWRSFVRGLNDVGFVAASLRAERARRMGI
jgi:rhomboid protease GluP